MRNVLRRIHGLAWILFFVGLFMLALGPVASAFISAQETNGNLAYTLRTWLLDDIFRFVLSNNHYIKAGVGFFVAAALSIPLPLMLRAYRLERWLCTRCGYDLTQSVEREGQIQCPECGARFRKM